MPTRCSKCCRALPAWDAHHLCQQHRGCSKLQPCATCAAWPAHVWQQDEAWRQANSSCLRSPVLTPQGADRPDDAAVPPASLGYASSGSPEPAVQLHASEDSDWGLGGEPPRPWRPIQASEASRSSPGPQRPAQGSGAGEAAPAAGLTTLPQGAPQFPPPPGRPNPLPTGGTQGEAGTALPGEGSSRARPVNPPRGLAHQHPSALPGRAAGPPSAPAHWSGELPDEAPLAELCRGVYKRPAARRGSSSSMERSDEPKRKKKKGKKDKPLKRGKGKKGKGKPPSKPAKGKANPSDADLFRMMALVAGRHGWLIDRPAPGDARRPDPPAALHTPAMAPPPAAPVGRGSPPMPLTAPPPVPPVGRRLPQAPPSLPQAPPSRAPAALGAPPGEESFLPHAPVPVQGATEDTEDTTSVAGSDWSSAFSRSYPGTDAVSVTSGAQSVMEQEALPSLKRLGEEAEALLLRYLGEFYSAAAEGPRQQEHPSLLFRDDGEPESGIPLTPDFRREYERISKEAPPRGTAASLKRAFLFKKEDTARFLASEKLSPELLALGEHLGAGNPLKRRQYVEEDRRWDIMSMLCRSSMRLAAYAGALSNLAVQANQLGVSREDRSLLDSLQLSITELLWKQSTRAAFFTTRRRRDIALSALGFADQQRVQLTRDMPFTGPFLFSGQFTPRIKEELAVRQQARELAGQLRKAKAPGARYTGRPRGYPRPPAMPARAAAPPPPPQRGRGARGHRGRSHKGKSRGQRGHSSSAQGRGGF